MQNRCLTLLVLALAAAAQMFAQTSAGVNGVVVDSSGAMVPNAQVIVTNLDTGATRETVTNESGVYQFPLLQPGRYSIIARKQGFKQVTRDGVELELNQVAKIDFTNRSVFRKRGNVRVLDLWIVEVIEVIDDDNVVTLGQQSFDKVRADKSRSAGDQDFHSRGTSTTKDTKCTNKI